MNAEKNRTTICIDRVRPDEAEALLSLYVDLFHDREPLTKCLGFSRERMMEVARSMYSRASANPRAQWLCWVARDRAAENKAVGFIVCDDPAEEDNPPVPEDLTDHEREKLTALIGLMEDIRKPVQGRIGSETGRCLHIAAVGVAPGYEGAGIATRLLHTALADATARGFVCAFSECTSMASRTCHEKAGFKNLHGVALNEFSVDGVCPFPDSDVNIYLLWKYLEKEPNPRRLS